MNTPDDLAHNGESPRQLPAVNLSTEPRPLPASSGICDPEPVGRMAAFLVGMGFDAPRPLHIPAQPRCAHLGVDTCAAAQGPTLHSWCLSHVHGRGGGKEMPEVPSCRKPWPWALTLSSHGKVSSPAPPEPTAPPQHSPRAGPVLEKGAVGSASARPLHQVPSSTPCLLQVQAPCPGTVPSPCPDTNPGLVVMKTTQGPHNRLTGHCPRTQRVAGRTLRTR